MGLTTTNTLTEGMVYNAMKEAIQEFFTNLPRKPTTTKQLAPQVGFGDRYCVMASLCQTVMLNQ